MGQIISYICDVSGVSSMDKGDFVEVVIKAEDPKQGSYSLRTQTIHKLIHRDVALKLHLVFATKNDPEPPPEPTLESKFLTLLKDYISELAYEAGTEGAIDTMQNRG